jgi:hypothetical protein
MFGVLLNRSRYPLALAALSAIALVVYLLASRQTYALGFPLDDAWIHQTYARSLGTDGSWAYTGNMSTGGSTAPLWTGLLAAGYWLKLDMYFWTYLLGWLGLWGLGLVGMWVFRQLRPEKAGWQLWIGAGLVFEWHLVWAAGSGMETLIFGLLAMAVLGVLVVQRGGAAGRILRIGSEGRKETARYGAGVGPGWRWLLAGALTGLSAWVRPEGITLLGPALLLPALSDDRLREKLRSLAWLAIGFAVLFAPYLIFNRLAAGAWWPNTFYAKQAEYAQLRQAPFVERFLDQAALPLVGAGLLLLPGFFHSVWRSVTKRDWAMLTGPLWMFVFLGSYAWRLPLTYQHGRYAIPAMAVFFVWGFAGLAGWLEPGAANAWRRVPSRVWGLALAGTLLAFYAQGAWVYGRDVAIIESEMVAAAHWVRSQTAPGIRVAAHDIGALGYFGGRDLLDLAGLVSPEVIPVIRDEAALARLLDHRSVDYLVIFPDWYPRLAERGVQVYSTHARFAQALGAQNLAIYRWQAP